MDVGQVCEPKKESPIDKAKSELQNNIEQTRDLLPRFETILASVLIEPNKESATPEGSQPVQCGLEEYLHNMTDMVVRANKYIAEIQSRIQL